MHRLLLLYVLALFVHCGTSLDALRRNRCIVLVRGGEKTNAIKKEEKNDGAVLRAIGWTAAEAGILYGALAWAAMADEPRLELTVYAIIAFGSSTIADLLLAASSAALSAPAKQVLLPRQTPNHKWYETLPKPVWTPPTWVFPIAWLLVSKPTQVLALSRLRNGKIDIAARLCYATHLALGDTWNRVFFGERQIGLGVYVIYSFVAALAASAILFARIDRQAGYLLLPTLAWVSIASALNLRIYQLVHAQPKGAKR